MVTIENCIEQVYWAMKIPYRNIQKQWHYPVITQEKDKLISGFIDYDNPIKDVPLVVFWDHSCTFKYVDFPFFRGADGVVLLKPKKNLNPKYFFWLLQCYVSDKLEGKESYQRHYSSLKNIKIPLPPLELQNYIVQEIEKLEEEMKNLRRDNDQMKNQIGLVMEKYGLITGELRESLKN